MKHPPSRGMVLSIGTAVLMHLLLFAVAIPAYDTELPSIPVPPETCYAMLDANELVDVDTVRQVNSPVVFSLPSSLGFSRELEDHDVQNQKTFTPLQVRSEYFISEVPVVTDAGDRLRPEQMMISAFVHEPSLPVAPAMHSSLPHSNAKRVLISPLLSGRLMGGVVLPSDLNQAVEKPWVVHASVRISEQGAVEHVFLDEPLDSPVLNQQVLQVLYSLRFQPGPAMESSIEIYSPETDIQTGRTK